MMNRNFKNDKLRPNLNLVKKFNFTTTPTLEILTHNMSWLPSKKHQKIAYIDLGNSETKAPKNSVVHMCV